MGKIIVGVIVGYVVMFLGVFVLMSAGYAALGASGSFRPGSWDVSPAWVVITIAVGLVAAIGGGFVCARIAPDARAPRLLAGAVVVLGIALAIPMFTRSAETVELGPRPETVRMMEAMTKAQSPAWMALLNPLLGAVGVMIGAGRRRGAAA